MNQHTFNTISDSLKSDHLFLLVGANTLPVWVAAKLLLRAQGQLYLVHSRETQQFARLLTKRFIEQGFKRPLYIDIGDASEPTAVYETVANMLEEITSGDIGLNYTGGTKVMAVQTYRAIEHNQPSSFKKPVFSYLDARTLEMRFDDSSVAPISVGQAPEVKLDLATLFALHDDSRPLTKLKREPMAQALAETVASLCKTPTSYQTWRKGIEELQKVDKLELGKRPLATIPELKPILETVAAGHNPNNITLTDLCQQKTWPFSKPHQLISWLEGPWLESYVFAILQQHQQAWQLDDIAHDMEFYLRQRDEKYGGFDIQVDVAAVRGYQLHFISCYGGTNTQTSTYKLLECATRVRQIGGDEGSAALVCMSEDAKGIEADVHQTWREGRIRVFGRHDLPNLASKLQEWLLR